MPIRNPQQLVEEFKKSGEFDRLRRDLLTQFKNGESISSFLSRVNDIIREKLESDKRLLTMSSDATYSELMQEMERYPLVQRAIADFPPLHGPNSQLRTSVNSSLARIYDASVSKDDQKKATTNGTTEASVDEDMQESEDDAS